ncbi:MAG: PKD domain-containing protein [Gemmatimonadaceae bacterium]
MPTAAKPDSPAKQLASFIAKFDPDVAKVARATRNALRKQFPTATEIVYDNYQALAIGFATTEKVSTCMFSVAVMAKGVSLSFYYGASLPDPDGILQGSGNQNRFVRLPTASVLEESAVQRAISAAVAHSKVRCPAQGRDRRSSSRSRRSSSRVARVRSDGDAIRWQPGDVPGEGERHMSKLTSPALFALLFALGACSAAPTLQPPAPTVTLSASPPLAGIRGVTNFSFQAIGGPSAPIFSWDFGDGSTGSGASVSHVFSAAKTFVVQVTATGTNGVASATQQITVGTLDGVWVRDAVQGVRVRLEIVQAGGTLSGTWWTLFDAGSPFGLPKDSSQVPLGGTVVSPMDITLEQLGQCQITINSGSVAADLKTMFGSGYWGNPSCGTPAEQASRNVSWGFRR